jgi:RES domain-containing protein
MFLWRISRFADLSGKGGELVAGRWHEKGVRVVYCADHPSTALLEMLVHLNPANIPDSFQLLKIECADHLLLQTSARRELHSQIHDAEFTRQFGTHWLKQNSECLLQVPSAIMPAATNILLNPGHPEARSIRIVDTFEYPFDRRLK